ncbi:MAG: hypothetical protein ABIS86_10110 [Streptosporangiaceae bacterium]
MTDPINYRDPHGAPVSAKAEAQGEDDAPAVPPLAARRLRLELQGGSSMTVRELRPVAQGTGGIQAGYEQLDNEILVGLRLAGLCGTGSAYPRELPRLIGYEADSPEPYALLEPLRGSPVAESAGQLPFRDRRAFQVSLLNGMRWLGAAGIAHRGLSPHTVRWDGKDVQITDFSQATLIGTPRTVVGAPPWSGPEQRQGKAVGEVTDRDDVYAVGRLIFYVLTGAEPNQRRLQELPDLAELLAGVTDDAHLRPSIGMLLERLEEDNTPTRGLDVDPAFAQGRSEFGTQRARKHPGTVPPPPTAPQPPPSPEPRPVSATERRITPAFLRRILVVAGALVTLAAVAAYLVATL